MFVQRHEGGIPTRERIGKDTRPAKCLRVNGMPPNGQRAEKVHDRLVKKGVNHQPGDVSVLILWGHAYHFALGHTKTRAGIEALDFGELRTVLTEFQREIVQELRPQWSRPESTADVKDFDPPRLDILAFDACDLSSIEVANHWQPFVDYMIASQIGIPLPGWPYETILGRLKEPPLGRTMTPAEFGAFAVRKFCEEYSEKDRGQDPIPVSLTLLDLAKAREAFEAVERLAALLAMAGGIELWRLLNIRDLFARSQTILESHSSMSLISA